MEVRRAGDKLTFGRTDMIDKTTKEIKQDDEQTIYKSLDEIGDDLPDHSPRFVLLSYPMTLVRASPRDRCGTASRNVC